MINNPSVSIITVTYNSEATLARTIGSVLNQEVAPYEYIIIDGCSGDKTLKIAESFKEAFKEKGIKYIIVSEPDEGIYDAMNKGIGMAGGDLIGMINSDDWYEPCAVKTVLETFKEEPFDMFYADLLMHMPSGSTFVKKARYRKYATSRDWNHPTTFIRKSMYERFKYRNETIHDDYDLVLRLRKAGAKTVVRNVVIADFTMNGTSHERSFRAAMSRVKIKYGIYRDNGYSPFYFVECFMVEMAKLIVG